MADLEAGHAPAGGASPFARLRAAVRPAAGAPAADAGRSTQRRGVKGAPRRPSFAPSDAADDDDSGGGGGGGGDAHPVQMDHADAGQRRTPLAVVRAALGEFFGVLVFVFFTTAAGAAKATGSPTASLVDVTLVSGLGLAAAILLAGPRSGGHLNPALSFAVALFRRGSLPLWELPIFVAAQVGGALAGAALTYALYHAPLAAVEAAAGMDRGGGGAVGTASVFFCTFPSAGAALPGGPSAASGGAPATGWPPALVGSGTAFLSEALGAAVLAAVVSAVLDARAVAHLGQETGVRAVAIGLVVFLLEVVLGPISSGCFNPARDLGPRLVAAAAGYAVAFPGDRGHVWVYLVAPLLGASVGVLLYDWVLSAGLSEEDDKDE